MATTSAEILLPIPAAKVRRTVCSAVRLGGCFHNVDRTEGDDDRAIWHLKSPFRATLGAASLQASIKERDSSGCEWVAEAPHLHWKGRFLTSELESGQTHLRFDLEIVDSGPLAAVHNAMIAVQIKNVAKLFEKNLRQMLEESHD